MSITRIENHDISFLGLTNTAGGFREPSIDSFSGNLDISFLGLANTAGGFREPSIDNLSSIDRELQTNFSSEVKRVGEETLSGVSGSACLDPNNGIVIKI